MNYNPRKPKTFGEPLDTEWGTYTSPYIFYDPDKYLWRQPAASQSIVRTRHPVIEPPSVPQLVEPFQNHYQRGTGLSADYEAEKIEDSSTSLQGWFVTAGIFGLLYLICQAFPSGGGRGVATNPGSARGCKRKRYSRATIKRLRRAGRRAARKTPRDERGRFAKG